MGKGQSKADIYKVSIPRRPSIFETVEQAQERKRIRLEEEERFKRLDLEKKEKQLERARKVLEDVASKRRTLTMSKEKMQEMLQSVENKQIETQNMSRKIFLGATDPENEQERMMTLRSLRILDTEFDHNFDRVTNLAKDLFEVPIVAISLIDTHRQWFKSIVGLDCRETCRNEAFCAYAIKEKEVFVVYDATEDDRFKNNSLVTGPPYIRFYAGAQIIAKDGFVLGTLCVIDRITKTPEQFGQDKKKILASLADGVARECELYKALNHVVNGQKLQASVAQFSRTALVQTHVKDCMEIAVVHIAEQLSVDRVSAIKIDGEENEMLAEFGSISFNDADPKIVDLVKSYVSEGNNVWVVDDITTVPNRLEVFTTYNIRNAIYVIIYSENKPTILVSLYRTIKPSRWGIDEINYIDSMSKSLSGIIEKCIYECRIHKEKERADELLLNILPRPIVNRMKLNNQTTIADRVDSVSVLFADIVGFTEMSQMVTPGELVGFLSTIFCAFDKIALKHGCEKVKTIGDCYLAAAGLLSHEDDHSSVLLDFALDILNEIQSEAIQSRHKINMRIGINTGPVVAGVIGYSKFIYDLWGDTVNTASRMESHGIPGLIQISEKTYAHLREKKDNYYITERGKIKVKGKGKMKTYLVSGRKTPSNVDLLTNNSSKEE